MTTHWFDSLELMLASARFKKKKNKTKKKKQLLNNPQLTAVLPLLWDVTLQSSLPESPSWVGLGVEWWSGLK